MSGEDRADAPRLNYFTVIKRDGRVLQQIVYDAKSALFASREEFEFFKRLFGLSASAREEITLPSP